MIIFLLLCLGASLFCVGIRLGMDEGMILHFIRKWYLDAGNKIQKMENKISIMDNDWERVRASWLLDHYVFREYLLKPISGCITCMSSVWGVPIFICLNHYFGGVEFWSFFLALPIIATLNTYIWTKVSE